MRYVVVCPFVYQPYFDAMRVRCRLENVLCVDNTVENLGVMRSHNLGVDLMRAADADWLVLLSAAIRFGERGGLDFASALEHCAGHAVVTAEGVYGWHLIAFARETVELAGRWDENFYPYGWDDNDYAIRVHKTRPGAVWSGIKALDLADTTMGHSVKLAGVEVDNEHHLAYFARKWGGRPEGQRFEWFHDYPFGEIPLPLGYWPEDERFTRGARWDAQAPPPPSGFFL